MPALGSGVVGEALVVSAYSGGVATFGFASISGGGGGSISLGTAITGTVTATSGTTYGLVIEPTYDETSGSASNVDLLIDRTQTALGSGSNYFISCQVAGAVKFCVDNTGYLTAQNGFIPGTLYFDNNGSNYHSISVVGSYLTLHDVNGIVFDAPYLQFGTCVVANTGQIPAVVVNYDYTNAPQLHGGAFQVQQNGTQIGQLWFTGAQDTPASVTCLDCFNGVLYIRTNSSGNATLLQLDADKLFIPNSAGVPSANPSGGGYLYVSNGALCYRGSSGTVTTLGPA